MNEANLRENEEKVRVMAKSEADEIAADMEPKWRWPSYTHEYAEWLETPMTFGNWPGNETDSELLAQLAEIRN